MIAYFDCFSGISGNMVLGALIDAGLRVDYLKKEIKKLKLKDYKIKISKVTMGHLVGTHVAVQVKSDVKRGLKDITSIINKSSLDKTVKEESIRIFKRLAQAESRVHNIPESRLHFHEVGDTDSIIDIVGAVIGLKKLGVEKIYCSPVHLGRGFVKCGAGILPVPAPATMELLKGVPVYGRDIEYELVTPTGAAIISTLSAGFGDIPPMKYEAIGYGAGSSQLEIPNMLRVMLGSPQKLYAEDTVKVIEANIDDMNPQVYDYLMERLFKEGALDVFLTQILMKKNRPAVLLSVLCKACDTDRILPVIFDETTTLGVRIYEAHRKKLFRKINTVKTKYGNVRVKTGSSGNDLKNIAPECEDCRKLALKNKVSIKEVFLEAKRSYPPSQKITRKYRDI